MSELQPLSPERALEMYLEQRRSEVTETTLAAHRYRLKHFVRWAENGDRLPNLNDLNGRELHQYRIWRREDGDLNTVSMQTQMSTLRVFMKFCEEIDAVAPNTHEKVRVPTLDATEGARDSIIDPGKVVDILEYLSTYHYASVRHTLMTLMWHTGARVGGVHSLDLRDFHEEDQRLYFEHRPRSGTTLKNGFQGERVVALSDIATRVLADYIGAHREVVLDEHGREPLLTTKHGRPAKTTLRDWVYEITQPCFYTRECPHDKEVASCEWRHHDRRSGCPSNNPPHDVRRGSITHYLSEDAPKEAVSDRMDVKVDTLDEHYDKRSEEVKSEQRRGYFT